MLQHDTFDSTQFACREANIVVERHRSEPELGRRASGIDVNVMWFSDISAVEVEPIRSLAKKRGHDLGSVPHEELVARSVD